mgnify:CR=1 FL=1
MAGNRAHPSQPRPSACPFTVTHVASVQHPLPTPPPAPTPAATPAPPCRRATAADRSDPYRHQLPPLDEVVGGRLHYLPDMGCEELILRRMKRIRLRSNIFDPDSEPGGPGPNPNAPRSFMEWRAARLAATPLGWRFPAGSAPAGGSGSAR